MKPWPLSLGLLSAFLFMIAALPAAEETRGWPRDEAYFPIAVWLQNPAQAARYQAAGINLYVGIWRGPTTNQLAELARAGMKLICAQNAVGLGNLDHPTIVGWMHDDEPDNAQSRGPGQGYGPPIPPERIVADYQRMRAADPNRPVLLNLGQGVAWDNYIGRGVRRNHPEDYPNYVRGCDIVSFDIYPVVHESPEVRGRLEYVARGVKRLREWAGPGRMVWNCIECTHISEPTRKASPAQVRTEVWMSLIHGSRGLIYFVHQFKPVFREAALLEDPEMLAAVTTINRQIHELAPVLNSASLTNGVSVGLSEVEGEVAWMRKEWRGINYLFTVNMRDRPVRSSFTLNTAKEARRATVLGENRILVTSTGRWSDAFQPYEVHLYRLDGPVEPR